LEASEVIFDRGLYLLEMSGDQGHPFVWRGRAWKRIGRRSHYEQSAIRHAL